MLHSPVTLVGTACSFHQKILKCSWDILPQKERDLAAPIKEGCYNSKQEKLSKKGHVKAIRKSHYFRHPFSAWVLTISPPMRNHNSANHKSGQFKQRNLHTPMAVQNPGHLQTV